MDLKKVKTFEELKLAKSEFYGPNSEFSKLKQEVKSAPLALKSQIGKKISQLKIAAEKAFVQKAEEIKNNAIEQKIASEWKDPTYPVNSYGSLHPLTLVEKRFRLWLLQNGYYETQGSEIESDEFNFEKLNILPNHPARDMQDSLYINAKTLLRTHNTGFSARELHKNKNQSFSQFTIGNVYRNDEDDSTHSHQFTQVDLVSVGNLSVPNLIWTLKKMLSFVLEEDIQIRLRPSYFPFTEPSVEVDVYFQKKWVEVLGAGMMHPQVMKLAGYTNKMTAFAAGIGVDRIGMIKYNVLDIREFYKNDLRFLNQFKGGF